ncbi:hypothetical protein K438DRAFT_1485170, partial [Mycena galopus ATCC 62051]
FIDKFRQDKDWEERKHNLYYPFASKGEWEFASWVTKHDLTLAATTEFLNLELVSNMHLSFKSAKDLRDRVESLPSGPKWKSMPWPTEEPTVKPLTLFYRNPLECLQSLLENPLVQDYIHFSPFRLWREAGKLMRVYTEWLSGDAAWEIQDKLPEGATVLGTILSSDKTQLTSMTGNREAHPVLISVSNIDMEFRMKASHHAFLLLALLPIIKFRVKDPAVARVLAYRVHHAIMAFILEPLKKFAEIGTMMNDPLGWRRWCFTPLVGYIVDTPESLLIAAVAGKQSSVTTASYLEFGDPFQHPPRTAEHTLSQLKELEEAYHPWDEMEAYIEEAKQMGLSGVHRPFWLDWPMAEPSLFLTPEVLHHWLKFFYDHVVKWCIYVVGDQEIDFRFSVLRPHTGMRHFKEGISKGKQATGREHRDIMRYLVPVVAGAADVTPGFLTAITSIVNFFYAGQAYRITEANLERLDKLLKTFHENKEAIIEAGARRGKKGVIENWWIPKLEFLQSVVPSIRANGVPIQWSADVTEHYHIVVVKEPARHTNNQNHEPQMVRNLDRKDKCRRFDLATAMVSAGVDFRAPLGRLSGTDRKAVNYFGEASLLKKGAFPNAPKPFRTFTSRNEETAFHLNRDASDVQLTVEAAATRFKLPDLRPALVAYLNKAGQAQLAIGGRRPVLYDTSLPFSKIQFWNSVRIQSKSYHDNSQILVPQTVNAAPPDPSGTWKCGRADAVLVNVDPQFRWPASGLGGHIICQLRMIFRVIPRDNSPPSGTEGFLAYVQRFDMGLVDPASGMVRLRRSTRADLSPKGDIIPLHHVRVPVEISPRFGKTADRRLKKETSLDYSDEYWLSKWFNKEFF